MTTGREESGGESGAGSGAMAGFPGQVRPGAVLYCAGVRGWAGEDRGRVGPGAAPSLTELCSHPQGYPGAGQAGPYSGGPYGGGAAPGQPYGAPPAGPYGGAAPGGERGAVLRGRRPRWAGAGAAGAVSPQAVPPRGWTPRPSPGSRRWTLTAAVTSR